MITPRKIPAPAPTDLMTYTIKVDGIEIPRAYNIVTISVTKEVNRISCAKIILNDGDPASSEFPISNSRDFIPGKSIEILAGYHSQEKTIFKGIIIKHGLQIKPKQASNLVVECKDAAVKLTIGRSNATFLNKLDSDAMRTILNKYPGNFAKVVVEPTSVIHPELIQYYVTDWDFIVSRAEVNGQLVFVDAGQMTIAKPQITPQPVLSLVYGATMYEFAAEIDARCQYPAVTGQSWDPALQNPVTSQGQPPVLTEQGNLPAQQLTSVIGLNTFAIQHSGQVAVPELKAWSDATLLRSRLAKIRGVVKCQGFADIKPGDTIGLNGVGQRFNGNAFISGVSHEICGGDWLTQVQFGLSPKWFAHRDEVIDTPAAGLVPAIAGLQIGIVSRIIGDPQGDHRVLVKIPMIDPQSVGIWARVATLDAGANRGSFFRPEIGDEVLLGFLNEDPRDPVILGMLHSRRHPPPILAAAGNPQKGWVTRDQLKLIFDDPQKSIQFATPSGNSLTLSDTAAGISCEDQNQNKIILTPEGITIESAALLELKAKGDINISGMNINLKAKANIKTEGLNVQHKAKTQFKAEGSAGVELSSSAIAMIKGSLVKIN